MPVTDIRLLITFKGHRKRKKLKMIIGPGSTDYLLDLWLTVANDRPDGNLTGWDKYDVAIAAGWEDEEPDRLVDALIRSGWLDQDDDGVYSLHDWGDHQGWVSGSEKRSKAARKAALIKNHGKEAAEEILRISADRRKKGADRTNKAAAACDPHDPAHADSQKTPAPSPSPSPLPSPKENSLTSVKPDEPAGPVSKNNKKHFSNQVGQYKDRIIKTCQRLDVLSARNGKRFSGWQWVQQKANQRGHPQAMVECLEYIADHWDETESPWGYADAAFKSKQPKYRERDHIAASKQFKKLWLSKEMRDLVGDIGERL